ncbi:MAG: glycosyltransferase family 39 protein, partial [Pirellulaceae bacterium]|nr:glycosyltransferase family 39 protein [Pirellulaceae bacterium]
MTPETTATVSRFRWIVIAVCLICLFSSLGASRFWDQDEGFFASTAASMYAQSDWVVPSFNGEMFGHKPPWMYWMMMVGYRLFGVGEFGARFFSAVFGMATALLVFRMGTRMFNARVGLLAGIALPTCLMFSVVSRAATPDVFLVFFSTLALYLFSRESLLNQDPSNLTQDEQTSILPQRWSSWAAMYLMMGFAALVKGPIGFLFPMAVIGLYLLIMTPAVKRGERHDWKSKAAALWRRFGPINF